MTPIRTFWDDEKNIRDVMKKRIVKAKVLSNKKICEDHFIMELDAPALGKNALPGQFVNVKTDNAAEQLLRIPLGIHCINKRGVSLLYKTVGKGTKELSKKKEKESINILGPLGNGFEINKKEKNSVLVSGGHGIAPLYALCEELKKKKGKIELFVGATTKDQLVCLDKFRKLGVNLHIATDDGSKGHKGYVTELLESYLKRGSGPGVRGSIYACGPKPMLKEVSRVSKKNKIPAQISVDEYMACGIGVCLGCAINTIDGYKLVCKDGPVFDAQEIVWG